MAFTTILVTVSMIAIVNADFPGFPGWMNNNNNQFPGFPAPMMRFGPRAMPTMPGFGHNFPFFQLPVFPTMTFPTLPSPSDIANAKPGKGGTFNGVMISSKTEAKRKEDGTIVKESGSTMVINDNGVVTVKKSGNAPDIITTNPPKKPLAFDIPNIPKIVTPKPFQFNFNNFEIPTIDTKKIETYEPGPNQNYNGDFIKVSSYSHNDNGNVRQGGSAVRVSNNNGHVYKEEFSFGDPSHS